LNDLEVFAADIQNAYLTSPFEDKLYSILGKEFGPHRKGKKAIVVRAWYGLKSAGSSFQNHLASCLEPLGYTFSRGNPDLWIGPSQRSYGEYYKYFFVNTDDSLAIGVEPKDILMKLNKYFKLKPESIHPPDAYLGTKIKKTILPNGEPAWRQISSYYVRNVVNNLEDWMVKEWKKLRKENAPTPISITYKPKVDDNPELSPDMANSTNPKLVFFVGLSSWKGWT
jgi:hypothetical protein